MTGVAVEQVLEFWCVELHRVEPHLKSLFAHPSIAASAAALLDGLLKNATVLYASRRMVRANPFSRWPSRCHRCHQSHLR